MSDDLKPVEAAPADAKEAPAAAEDPSALKLAYLAALAAAALVTVEGTRPAAVLVTAWDGERYTLVRSEKGKVPAAVLVVAGTERDDGAIGVTEKGLEERNGAVGWECACGPGCVEAVPEDKQHGVPAFSRSWAEGGSNVLRPGTWTDSGKGACVRVPCVELGGKPHNPPECR